jgi:hypothetical protein
MSGDPLLGGVVGIRGDESAFTWLKSFIYLELYAGLLLPNYPRRFCPPLTRRRLGRFGML